MSDLVFKVKGVIGDALMRGDDPANAAIRAVAEWLHDQHWHAANDLRRALEREELREPKP